MGAFAIPGIRMNDLEQRSLYSLQSTKEFKSIAITSARLVDDDIVNAVPVEGSRCRLISIISLLLLVGIILIVVLTQRSWNDPNPEWAKNPFLEKLKPNLTISSLQELENPDSVPYQALDWLLHTSNFEDYSFDCRFQRFAMAAFYFAT